MYFLKIKIPKYFRSNSIHIIHEELYLKYLNQTAIIRIHYDIDSIIIETLLTLPFYKYAERYSVAKQCASYIIKELRKKYLVPNTKNPFLDGESGFGSLHRKVSMTLVVNNVGQDLEERNNNVFLFGNSQIHNLIVRLELGAGIVDRIFVKLLNCYLRLGWYRINGFLSIKLNGNGNILDVRITDGINYDINGVVINSDNIYDRFDGVLERVYAALDICSIDVVNVWLRSAHFNRAIDMERSNIESTDIKILNQQNNNKRSLMKLGLLGYRDMVDKSHDYYEYEVHFNNYDNRSLETILDNIDYLFNSGDRDRENINKIFPTAKRLREILDGMVRLEALGIEDIAPFEITAADNYFKLSNIDILESDETVCGLYIKPMIKKKLRFCSSLFKKEFYRALKIGYKGCNITNLAKTGEVISPANNIKIKYLNFG